MIILVRSRPFVVMSQIRHSPFSIKRREVNYDPVGDMGSSFGPFQLHYGGMVPGVPRLNNPGLGDEFTAVTGLNASDPSALAGSSSILTL